MMNAGIVIISASPLLATALHRVLAKQMAVSIMRSPVDVSDDAAVAERLSKDGFSGNMITGLMHDARVIASEMGVSSIVASPRQVQ